MGVVAHSAPNYKAALASLGQPRGPVVTHAFVHSPLYEQVCQLCSQIVLWNRVC